MNDPASIAASRAGPAFLSGSLVDLRPLTEDQYVLHNAQWTNDPDVCALLNRGTFPTTPDQHRKAFADLISSGRDIEFLIAEVKSQRVVGITGLHSLQWIPRHCEFRIMIGDKTAWGKGYGSEALHLLCRYAFDRLNMNKVWLGVNLANERAVGSYEKAGFVREGVLRQEFHAQGRYYDVLRMSLLRSEFGDRDAD